MVIVNLYSKCLKITYKNYLFSKANFFIVLTTLLNVIIPFIFSYNSRGFWLKHDTIYEQPDVKFKGEYIFLAHTNDIGLKFICNNFAYFDDNNFEDSCSEIKVVEIDNNFDGKVDLFNFELHLNLPQSISITRFDLILTLDYKLKVNIRDHQNLCTKKNICIYILLQEFLQDTSQIYISSILELSQLYPIFCHPRIINTEFNTSIINENDFDSYKFNNIIKNYFQKNVTTHLKSTYKSYGGQSELFSLKLTIKYPEHMFYYTPGFWQVIKWAWIQYISIYIILWWIIKKIRNYVFDNHIFVFYEQNPIKYKKD
nr:transmembrane protein 231 [Onthophagus taurus]